MSDTKWRISGGLGVPDQPAQVMTQGLGFPLRPVDGAPPQDSGEALEDVPIAEGLFVQWMGPYQAGQIYPPGSMVLDEGFTMVALVATVTKPAPQPVGNPTWGLPDVPGFASPSNLSVVYSGHQYTFLESGWLRAVRVWAPELTADTHYRVVVVDITDPNKPITRTIDNPVLTEDAWRPVAFGDSIVAAGTVLLVYLDALNSGSDTVVAGGWTYNGVNNAGLPPVGGWNRSQQQDVLFINKTDLDATDRTSELAGMGPDTSVIFASTADPNKSYTYRINSAPTDLGTYFQYAVELLSAGPAGGPDVGLPTTMTANVPVAQVTEYAEIAASVPTPTWATVEGYLQFGGVDQGGAANSYGVDLEFDVAVINTAWDFVSSAN